MDLDYYGFGIKTIHIHQEIIRIHQNLSKPLGYRVALVIRAHNTNINILLNFTASLEEIFCLVSQDCSTTVLYMSLSQEDLEWD